MMKKKINWKLLALALAFTAPLPFIVMSQGCGSDPYTAPVIATDAPIIINNGDSSTNVVNVTLKLYHQDATGVAAYYVSENSATPAVDDLAWQPISPAVTTFEGTHAFTLSPGEGMKTVYVWYKNSGGTISSPGSDGINYTTQIVY